MNLAPFIDHTLLKPTTTLTDIKKLCEEAIEYGFAAVCVPPFYVCEAGKICRGSAVKVATVIGFPFGYSHFSAKLKEVQKAMKDGADEADMVINLAALKSQDFTYLEKEIVEITNLTKGQFTLKLIIESGILTGEEIIKCCNLYAQHPVDFLKTSTGYAETGATVEAVQLMRQHLPSSIRIKASGGIKTSAFAKQLVEAGATRLGCSASIAIVKGNTEATSQGY